MLKNKKILQLGLQVLVSFFLLSQGVGATSLIDLLIPTPENSGLVQCTGVQKEKREAKTCFSEDADGNRYWFESHDGQCAVGTAYCLPEGYLG